VSNNFNQPHKRFNILTGEWVLVSPQRNNRPWQGQEDIPSVIPKPEYDATCYLCPNNNRNTGNKNPDYANTYVFNNDFPALLDAEKSIVSDNELLVAQHERGICKVVCFSPNHSLTLAEMPVESIINVIETWINEFNEIKKISYIKNIQIFENKGQLMGCSNPHPHGQIWAQESIPNIMITKSERFTDYFEKNKRNILVEYIQQEQKLQERIVDENETCISLVPFWAVWPFEIMILPKRQIKNITDLNSQQQKDFAELIQKTTIRYDNLFKTSFPYSAGIHQAPIDEKLGKHWHLHMLFYPPLLRSASIKKHMVGYEMFGMPQRDITAEQAAEQLRNQKLTHYSTSV
jgi:UDPglucose--hexose-1-phosphate uridylyltransferase